MKCMRYRYVTVECLVLLCLEGDADVAGWQRCFFEIGRLFIQNGYDRLLIDGSRLDSFGLSRDDCRRGLQASPTKQLSSAIAHSLLA